MANINYTDIASRFSNPTDGQKYLEGELKRVPTAEESASLTAAYSNLANSKNTPKPDTGNKSVISKAVSTQGFTTGYGMISAEAANELIGADKIADAAIAIGSALFSSKPLKEGLKNLFTTGLGNLFDGAMNILEKEVELRNKLNSQIAIGGIHDLMGRKTRTKTQLHFLDRYRV